MLRFEIRNDVLSKILPYILVMASPFIACLIFYECNGSSLFHYDAYNAIFNDELCYYHATQMIRDWWAPEGYTGYNEVLAPKHGYGPYNFVTFLPYVLTSFLTGTDSHNFIVYCNLIMILLSLVVLIRFCEVNIPESIAITIFLSTFLIAEYYIFSGMSEASHIAFMIAEFGLMIKLYRSRSEMTIKQEWVIIWVATVLTIIYGLIRPYELSFLALPAIYLLAKKSRFRSVYLIVVSIMAITTLLMYFYLANNYGSPYFDNVGGFSEYIDYVRHGQIYELVSKIIQKNIDSFKMVNYLETGDWSVAVTTLFLLLQALTVILVFVKLKRKEYDMLLLFDLILLIISIVIYESNVLFYILVNMKRTILGITILLGLLLCVQLRGIFRPISFVPSVCITLMILLVVGGNAFVLPQEAENHHAADDVALKEEFESLMPFSGDHWDHTLAFSYTADQRIMYLFPTYLGLQCCHPGYLVDHISDHSIKSKYLWVCSGDSIDEACQNAGLEKLWTNGSWCIYSTR